MNCLKGIVICFLIISLSTFLIYPKNNPVKIELISNGNKLNAEIYTATVQTSCPTMVLLHGYPGSEGDTLGLGKTLSENGINVLTFNYQGTWTSEGNFSFESSMQDLGVAIKFLKQKENISKFKIDTSRIVVVGYSFGGSMALTAALTNSEITKIISIAGPDESVFARKLKSNPRFRKVFTEMLKKTEYPEGPAKVDILSYINHWINHLDDYDLVKYAQHLKDKEIFLIGGWKDNSIVVEEHIIPLFRKLQQLKAKQVKIKVFNTDHTFGNVREKLNQSILKWIKNLSKNRTKLKQK